MGRHGSWEPEFGVGKRTGFEIYRPDHILRPGPHNYDVWLRLKNFELGTIGKVGARPNMDVACAIRHSKVDGLYVTRPIENQSRWIF